MFPKIDEDDRSRKPCCQGCRTNALNEKCVCCDKPIKGERRLFPKIAEDDRSGKPCCRGCRTNALNEKCVCCDKPIKGGGRYLFPTIDDDDRSRKPCCQGCRTKAIEKKNFDKDNFCGNCEATRAIKVGGISAQTDSIFGDKFWECQSCKNSKAAHFRYIAKLKKQGKPKPRQYKRRKIC